MPKRPATPAAPLSYRPSAFYFRKALREAKTTEQARALGMTLCAELEDLKAWVRSQGLIPPRFRATAGEATDKSWAGDVHADAAPLADRPEAG